MNENLISEALWPFERRFPKISSMFIVKKIDSAVKPAKLNRWFAARNLGIHEIVPFIETASKRLSIRYLQNFPGMESVTDSVLLRPRATVRRLKCRSTSVTTVALRNRTVMASYTIEMPKCVTWRPTPTTAARFSTVTSSFTIGKKVHARMRNHNLSSADGKFLTVCTLLSWPRPR